jgi:hypothetical protein
MLLSHMAGASFVEAAITALAVSYLQKTFPELLARQAGPTAEAGTTGNAWVPAGAIAVISVAVVFVAGLVKGDGHLSQWAGLDWTTVDWGDAALTVLVSLVVTAVVLPIIYVALRGSRGTRIAVIVFAALMIWAPIGLIAPGGAFAEDSSASQQEVDAALSARAGGDSSLFDALPDVNQECECVPSKIGNVDFASHTLLAGYQPPWVSEDDPAWQQNLGYQVAGVAGIAMFAALGLALYQFGRWLVPSAPPDWRTA